MHMQGLSIARNTDNLYCCNLMQCNIPTFSIFDGTNSLDSNMNQFINKFSGNDIMVARILFESSVGSRIPIENMITWDRKDRCILKYRLPSMDSNFVLCDWTISSSLDYIIFLDAINLIISNYLNRFHFLWIYK